MNMISIDIVYFSFFISSISFYLLCMIFTVSKARLLQLEEEFHYLQNTNSAAPVTDGSVIDVEGARK